MKSQVETDKFNPIANPRAVDCIAWAFPALQMIFSTATAVLCPRVRHKRDGTTASLDGGAIRTNCFTDWRLGDASVFSNCCFCLRIHST